MTTYVRAHIGLETEKEVQHFVKILDESSTDKFFLENFDASSRVDASSILGALYMASRFSSQIYLINMTHDGQFPYAIDEFRK